MELITTRRMSPKLRDEAPGGREIEMLLEAAVSAPNHHLTQPWRFIVLSGSALDELGEVMAERVRSSDQGAPGLEEKLQKERSKPKRAPVIITVVYVPSRHPKAVEVEDRYAVGAAVQNMLLAAHGMGLGAYWRTGPACEDRGVREFLQLRDGEEIAAFVYLGYPAGEIAAAPARRATPAERTTWMGSPSPVKPAGAGG